MNAPYKIAILASGAFLLSGCASIFGGKQARVDNAERVDIMEVYSEYAAEQLTTGRDLLQAGAFVSALKPLRRASADPKTAPAAYNAMGVAYAKLGREDVASRLFGLALMLEPENRAFASNLKRAKQRFQGGPATSGPELAAHNQREIEESADSGYAADLADKGPANETARSSAVASAFGANVMADAGTSRLQRVSALEVRISGPRQTPRSNPRTTASSGYPIRVKLSPSRDGKKSPEADEKAYPFTVRF